MRWGPCPGEPAPRGQRACWGTCRDQGTAVPRSSLVLCPAAGSRGPAGGLAAAPPPEPRRRRLTAVACRGPGSASRRPVRCVVTCVRAQLPGSVCCAGSSLGLRPGGAGARGAVSAGHSGRLLEAEPALSGGRGGGSERPSGTAPPWASSPPARTRPRVAGGALAEGAGGVSMPGPRPPLQGLARPAVGARRFLGQDYF